MNSSTANKISRFFRIALLSLTVGLCNSSFALEVANLQSELSAVDNVHHQFNALFYKTLSQDSAFKGKKFKTLEALEKAAQEAASKHNYVKAITLIIKNKQLLTRYYYSPQTITLLKMLLDHNAVVTAKNIINEIKDQDDDRVNMQLNYLLTDFAFQRQAWTTVLANFKNEIKGLPQDQYEHALMMKGMALKKVGKHDLSLAVYEKIPRTSSHAITAQFNTALANIRLGWWSDGHRILQYLIKKQSAVEPQSQEIINTLDRLQVTLGYSSLNQAFYRNARKNFQLIGTDTRYANQALLGIALTAAHQDDYIGALNATRYLKDIPQDDLPIDEAFLLMPFFYEKTQQFDTASAGYSEAEFYYQKKISRLNKLMNAPLALPRLTLDGSEYSHTTSDKVLIKFSANYPDYYFKQQQYLQDLSPWIEQLNNSKLTQAYNKTTQRYQALTENMAKEIMQKRINELQSYLNQSRYGLARLYDNNTVAQ